MRCNQRQIRFSAGCDQYREPAERKAQGADPRGIEPGMTRPVGQHEIHQPMQLSTAIPQLNNEARGKFIVYQSRDHKARLSQGKRSVDLFAQGALRVERGESAMRDDDQR
ncbi:MAG: hypothetical protein WDN69_19025 [Aliidongia sp.]